MDSPLFFVVFCSSFFSLQLFFTKTLHSLACVVYIFNMKTREQNKIAAWLDISPSALSNIFSGRRGMSRRTAVKVSAVAGIPFEKLMLGGGDEIKEEVLKAWSDRLEAAQ